MPSSSLSAGLAVLAGIVTVLSPCVLPILPMLVGRSLISHRYGPAALVAGLIAGFATIGSLVGVTSVWFAQLASILRYVAIALLFGFSLLAIFPEYSYRLLSRLRFGSWLKESPRVGLAGEFWLGTQLGLLWTPCAGPVLGSILTLAAVRHDAALSFILLLFYGLGVGIPLLAIGYGGRHISRHLLKLRPYSTVLQKVGGVIVAVTAIAILLGWDVQIQLWLAPIFPPLSL